MTTPVEICNKALRIIGVAPITTLGADGTPQDVLMNDIYAEKWRKVFRDAGVNTTRARVQLKYTTMALALSSVAVGTGITATAALAFFNVNDVGSHIKELGAGATGIAEITAYTSPTVVTISNTTAWHGTSPVALNGWYLSPLGSGMEYVYQLPTGYISAIEMDDARQTYLIEGQRILSNGPGSILHFHWYDDNPDHWDDDIREAVIGKLAVEAAWPLTRSKTAVELALNYSERAMRAARGASKAETQPERRVPRSILRDVRY
jgi:hypothetical protein